MVDGLRAAGSVGAATRVDKLVTEGTRAPFSVGSTMPARGGVNEQMADLLQGLQRDIGGIDRDLDRLKLEMKASGNPAAAELIELQLRVQQVGLRIEMASRMAEGGVKNFNEMTRMNV